MTEFAFSVRKNKMSTSERAALSSSSHSEGMRASGDWPSLGYLMQKMLIRLLMQKC